MLHKAAVVNGWCGWIYDEVDESCLHLWYVECEIYGTQVMWLFVSTTSLTLCHPTLFGNFQPMANLGPRTEKSKSLKKSFKKFHSFWFFLRSGFLDHLAWALWPYDLMFNTIKWLDGESAPSSGMFSLIVEDWLAMVTKMFSMISNLRCRLLRCSQWVELGLLW